MRSSLIERAKASRATALALVVLVAAACGSGAKRAGELPAATGATTATAPFSPQPGQSGPHRTPGRRSSAAATRGKPHGSGAHPGSLGSSGVYHGGGSGSGSTGGSGPAGSGGGGGSSGGSGGSYGSGGSASAQSLRPGTYVYSTQGHVSAPGVSQSAPSPTTLVVAPAANGQQRADRVIRNQAGDGTTTSQTYALRSDGVHLVSVTTSGSYQGISDSRTMTPTTDAFIGGAHTKPGDSSQFTMSGSGITAHVSLQWNDGQAVSVGGTSVSTLELTTTTSFSGAYNGNSTAEDWIDSDGLPVMEHVQSSVSTGLGHVDSDETSTLQSLTPQ